MLSASGQLDQVTKRQAPVEVTRIRKGCGRFSGIRSGNVRTCSRPSLVRADLILTLCGQISVGRNTSARSRHRGGHHRRCFVAFEGICNPALRASPASRAPFGVGKDHRREPSVQQTTADVGRREEPEGTGQEAESLQSPFSKKKGLNAEALKPLICNCIFGAPGRIRTHDPLVRR